MRANTMSVTSSDVLSSVTSSTRSGHTSPDGDYHRATAFINTCTQWTASLSPVSGCFGENAPSSDTLSQDEVSQIEAFHKGLHSQVYVCPAVASLYIFVDPATKNSPSNTRNTSSQKTGWTLHISEAVPVIVQVTRPDKNAVYFVLADRRTGFPLWREAINAESNYQAKDVDYHEFLASSLHTRVGLRISSIPAATRMLHHVLMLTVNTSVFGHNDKKKKKKSVKVKKTVTPQKNSISPPCCFTHVAHVAHKDQLLSLTDFVNGKDDRFLLR